MIRLAGGVPQRVNATAENDFSPKAKNIRDEIDSGSAKSKVLFLNYPSNPTAQVVDLDFYGAIVDFCKREGIWILSDLAYAEIYFDGVPPPSVLQVPGASKLISCSPPSTAWARSTVRV